MSTKILYFVCSGIDPAHFWDAKPFDRLKDAKEYAQNLPLTPQGLARPYRIERWKYEKANNYWNETASSNIVYHQF